jgi:hypothetical protein
MPTNLNQNNNDRVVINVEVRGSTAVELQLRGQADDDFELIGKSLDRYFYALFTARKNLNNLFNEQELVVLLNAIRRNTLPGCSAVFMFKADIEDTVTPSSEAEIWGVDGKMLMKKLNGLDEISNLALIDAIERWWVRIEKGEKLSASDLSTA